MNKKFLVIAVALMAVAMLATPVFGTAQAWRCKRNVKTVTLEPFVDPPTISGATEIIAPTEKFYDLSDGSQIRIAWGALRDLPYVGELGQGVLHLKTILSVGKQAAVPFGLQSKGSGLYQITLDITTANPDENYGTGTFKGYVYLKWDYYLVPNPTTFRFEEWWTISLCGNGLKVNAEAYSTLINTLIDPGPPPVVESVYTSWWTTTTTIS
jgi:hypothetical protein